MIFNDKNKTYYFNKLEKDRNYYFEYGDEKDNKKIQNQLKIKCFDNDANLSIRLLDDSAKVVISDPTDSTDVSLSTVYDHKPEDNVIVYSIRSKNINFCKQPTMAEYTAETGLECSIPANLEHGYICFHTNKRSKLVGKPGYKTGEVFQLPRPKAVDSEGVTVLCDLDINEEDNTMIATMPLDFYNNAIYPVVIY